ncbi:DNA repair protein RecO [Algirhabdus cladophorae]|uniref:DNA repair protein RecO n=1 Tax=Algirhabdus cladophorae TaxID=3377108 RepID=UPI003B84A241
MEWRDQGALLSVRRHGENAAIIDVFTAQHGRHAGVVRGATSRKVAPILQPGAQIDVAWRARLDEHIGSYSVEPVRSRAAVAMANRTSLAALNGICAILGFALPEREPHDMLYQKSINLLDLIGNLDVLPLAYLQWEMALLEDLGYGLDLSCCAATGAMDDLIYVSPKSGRAVSRLGAGKWATQMLPLPQIMLGQGDDTTLEIVRALDTTGYFMTNGLAKSLGNRAVPEARARLLDAFLRLKDH